MTNVACKLLDLRTGQCADYKNRRAHVPDCIRLTPKSVRQLSWLPETCAYRRRADDLPLPDWHYLLTGDRNSVHAAGASVKGRAISETGWPPAPSHHLARRHGSDGDHRGRGIMPRLAAPQSE
jgi:uncharacterized cysteine cluster protein YcgN (CxxCxxCC family)